jgi:maleamate amidohydrolase
MPVWDDIISDDDRERYRKYQAKGGIPWGARPAVVVVDMNYAFVDDRFSTGDSSVGLPAVRHTRTLLDKARQQGWPVVFVTGQRWNTQGELGHWKSGGPRPVADSSNLPDPFALHPELGARPDEAVVIKSKPSGFFGTHLTSLLTYHRVDTVIITGISTSGCVRASVIDAFSYSFRVIVPEECVADRGRLSHKINLFDMQMKYADVVPVADAVKYLEDPAAVR